MRRISQKVPLSTFYILVLYSLKHPILEVFLVKNHPNNEKPLSATKNMKTEMRPLSLLVITFEKGELLFSSVEQIKLIHVH